MEMTMMNNRWITTAASIWIQTSCGPSYAFGIYSSILKSSQGYDQSTLDTVSVFKDIGANCGVISGLIYAAIVARGRRGGIVGPWSVHLAGAAQILIGYLLIWMTVVGIIDRPPVMMMCLFMLVAAHAQTFFSTANVVTAVANFPQYSGTIVGIMKGFVGLSGAVLIQAYQAFLPGNPSGFILMLAILPTIVSISLMFLVKIHPTSNGIDKKYLNWFSYIALLVAMYLLVLIIFQNISTMSKWAHLLTFSLLLLMLTSLFRVANKAQIAESTMFQEAKLNMTSQLIDGNSYENENLLVSKDINLVQAMCTLNFWSLCVAMLCGMGSGMATINNISQIGESLNYKTEEINTLVSLWSIWNFLGRFGAGYISDLFLHSRGWARPMFMAVTLATMSVGHLIIASGFSGNLYVGSILVGICYGSQWSLMPTITSELFGVLNMGTIFNTISTASPVGSSILSVLVVGKIYDREASGDGTCFGTRCFMLSFLVLAFVSFLGFLVALTLFFRTRRFYGELWLRHSSR
ncbi:protein NUCLEAR FUSION DEFECTIVE 4-like [Impatiens glandulifera]|uniref:protein NUCLEAR FUSION DEFECTIVE 4-like n=1 Tax=Impatiens glandulifera TaxID=253017 RepID=UPI001FB05FD7|nr:protein NUCLEAR FUSION DEFECTIVE 4-like [Impatiens glandulifera]